MNEQLDTQQQPYSTLLRQTNPEKMTEIEDQVRLFLKAGPLLKGETLNDKEIARVANTLANRMHRKFKENEEISKEEMGKAIEGALYESVGERLKLKESGLRDSEMA